MFPDLSCKDAGAFMAAYFDLLAEAARAVDPLKVTRAAELLNHIISQGGTIYSCGNGGSAAIADHLSCDFLKGTRTHTTVAPRVFSLVSTTSLVTAISNDISYDEVFRYQLESLAKPKDALFTISSSGNSENIVRALEWANSNGIPSIALTGFSGGRSAALATVNIHVPINNYGVVEDVHQSIMHLLAQFLRVTHLHPEHAAQAIF